MSLMKGVLCMLEHLNNIIIGLDKLSSYNYKFNQKDIDELKKSLIGFKCEVLKNNLNNISLLELKNVSNLIYEINYENLFSELTDYISNELYAFEFLLQEKLKKGEK